MSRMTGNNVNKTAMNNHNAIKEALAKAIHEKMLAKTRKVVGNQTLHKSVIDNKMSLNEQLKKAEKDRRE